MITKRTQYINSDLLYKIQWAADAQKDSIMDHTIIIQKKYDITNILKLLHPLLNHSLRFTELYDQSKIRMKDSFLEYYHFCLDMGFMKKKAVNRTHTTYTLTDRGSVLLGLFLINDKE